MLGSSVEVPGSPQCRPRRLQLVTCLLLKVLCEARLAPKCTGTLTFQTAHVDVGLLVLHELPELILRQRRWQGP